MIMNALYTFSSALMFGVVVLANSEKPQHSTRLLEGTNQVIIKYKDGKKDNVQAFMERVGGMDTFRNGEATCSIPEYGIMIGKVTKSLRDALEANEDVERVELDVLREVPIMDNFESFGSNNQHRLELPYGIFGVQAVELWNLGFRGEGARVCVIDSGIDGMHPDFNWGTLDGTTQGNQDRDDWDEDLCGHGTHTSGTIGASGDDGGIPGVAPDASIFMVRMGNDDCRFMSAFDLIEAALECKAHGAQVISMSLSGSYSQTEEDVLNTLFHEDGILTVAAAGNKGEDGYMYPASYPAVMSVAATNSNNERAGFSQVNDQVDIAAPGVGVLSTLPQDGCEMCSEGSSVYGYSSGTSMACPHVAGVAALLFGAVPGATAQDVRDAMEGSALDLGDEGRDDHYGHGLVQAADALNLLINERQPCTACRTNVCGSMFRCLYTDCQDIDGSLFCGRKKTADDGTCSWTEGTWRCESCHRKEDGNQACCERCTYEAPPFVSAPTSSPTQEETSENRAYTSEPTPEPTDTPQPTRAPTRVPTPEPTADTPQPTPGPTREAAKDPEDPGSSARCKQCDRGTCAGGRCLYQLCQKLIDGWYHCGEAREVAEGDQAMCQWNTGRWRCSSCNKQGDLGSCCEGCSAVGRDNFASFADVLTSLARGSP